MKAKSAEARRRDPDKKGVFGRLGSDDGLDLGRLNDDTWRIWFGSIRSI
jgi:hypothetical protein